MDREAKKKILIVGASGFIGSHLVEEALQQGHEIYAGIRKTSNLQFLPQNKIQFLEFDLSSKEQIQSSLQSFLNRNHRFDFIVYNAGLTYAKKTKDFFEVNFQNTKNFTDALKESGMQFSKFVFISSLSAFGPGNSSFQPIELSHSQKPISSYGKSKLMAEEYIRSLENFPFLIINPTAVYGPRDRDFLKFVSLVNSGFEFVLGRSKQMISLLYVKDLAKAIIFLLASPNVNRSFIVSDQEQYNKEEITQVIKSILNKKTIKIRIPATIIKAGANLTEKIYRIAGSRPFLNNEKLAEMITANWLCNSTDVWKHINDRPDYLLEKGMMETIDWYRKNHWL